MSKQQVNHERRQLLKIGLATSVAACLPGSLVAAVNSQPVPARRQLSFYNTHTGESLDVCYCLQEKYCSKALRKINYILRDHRTNEIKAIDPSLLDLLFALSRKAGGGMPFHVISGYRSPETNAMLRSRSSQVARKSLHLQGKAIDIRCPGCNLATLRQMAMALKGGGVGYYPQSNFIHVDTGRVRYW